MKVSIVIPCYNEKNTIERIVEAVRSAAIESKEIIVVDDCSQDETQAVERESFSTGRSDPLSSNQSWQRSSFAQWLRGRDWGHYSRAGCGSLI